MTRKKTLSLPSQVMSLLEKEDMFVLSGGVDVLVVANNGSGSCSGTNNSDGLCTGTNNGSGRCGGTNNNNGRCDGNFKNITDTCVKA